MLDILVIIIFFLSLGGIFVIVGRKISQLKIIDTTTLTKEIQDRQKKDLLEQRLDRKIKDIFIKNPNKDRVLNLIKDNIEKSINDSREDFEFSIVESDIIGNPEKLEKYLSESFSKIETFIKSSEYNKAEDLCFQAFKVSKDNIDILDYLAQIYYLKNEYDKAIDTYEYILSVIKKSKNKNNSREKNQKIVKYSIKLSDIFMDKKNYKKISSILKDCLLIDENNPKILYYLIESYINLQDRFMALKMLDRMRVANPENSKIDEFKNRIDEMFKK